MPINHLQVTRTEVEYLVTRLNPVRQSLCSTTDCINLILNNLTNYDFLKSHYFFILEIVSK